MAVREGNNVNLSCIIIEGSPHPEIHWFKENSPLEQEKKTTLLLTKVSAKHNGRYKCKGENEGGSSQDSIYVTVDSKSHPFV